MLVQKIVQQMDQKLGQKVRKLATPRARRGAIAACLLMTLAACLYAEVQVQTTRVVPGVFALPGVTHLILSDFAGPGGAEVAHAVASKLMQRRSFAVTDLIASRDFAGLNWGEQQVLAHDSRSTLGTDAGIVASVVQHEIEDDLSFEEHFGADGHVTTTYTRTGLLRLQVLFRAVDPQTGALFDARPVAVRRELGQEQVHVDGSAVADGAYIQSLFAARDAAQAFFAAYEQVAEGFCDLVAMKSEPAKVTLYHNKNDVREVRALEGIKRGQWTAALSTYRDFVDAVERTGHTQDEHRAMAHYNLGIAYAYSGALSKGLYELEWSQALRDTSLARAAIGQTREWLFEAQQPRYNNGWLSIKED